MILYVLGDCAYSSCKCIVQSFKKVTGQSNLTPTKEVFNMQIFYTIVGVRAFFAVLKKLTAVAVPHVVFF